MSDSQVTEFVLYRPDQRGSVRVRADVAEEWDGLLRLRSGGSVVAISHPCGLAVDSRHLVSDVALLPAPPAMVLGESAKCDCWHAVPVAAVLLGFMGGFGVALSWAGMW